MKVYRDLEKAKKDGYTKFVKSSKYEPCYQHLVSEAIPTGIVYKKVSVYKCTDSGDTAKVITWAAANNSADIWLEKLTKTNSHTISDAQLDVIYKAAKDKYYAEATDKVINALANFNPDMFVSMEAFEKWLEKTKKVMDFDDYVTGDYSGFDLDLQLISDAKEESLRKEVEKTLYGSRDWCEVCVLTYDYLKEHKTSASHTTATGLTKADAIDRANYDTMAIIKSTNFSCAWSYEAMKQDEAEAFIEKRLIEEKKFLESI